MQCTTCCFAVRAHATLLYVRVCVRVCACVCVCVFQSLTHPMIHPHTKSVTSQESTHHHHLNTAQCHCSTVSAALYLAAVADYLTQ